MIQQQATPDMACCFNLPGTESDAGVWIPVKNIQYAGASLIHVTEARGERDFLLTRQKQDQQHDHRQRYLQQQ